MNLKNAIPLVLAVVLGLVALFVARKVMSKDEGDTGQVAVVVAKREVPAGAALTADALMVTKMPAEQVPSQSFATIDRLANRVVGASPLVKGQAIVEPLLAAEGTGTGVQAMIPNGMRAMTIEVNEFSGVAGMLIPGSRVDVIGLVRDDKHQQPMSHTVLQNVKVVAVGRTFSPPPTTDGAAPPPPSNAVTLLVSQKDAQILQLACQSGRPWLVLRNGIDDKIAESGPTAMNEVHKDPAGPYGPEWLNPPTMLTSTGPTTRPTTGPAADVFAAPAKPAQRTVTVIRAGVTTEVTMPDVMPAKPEVVSPRLPVTPQAPEKRPLMTGVDASPVSLNTTPKSEPKTSNEQPKAEAPQVSTTETTTPNQTAPAAGSNEPDRWPGLSTTEDQLEEYDD